MSALVVAVMGLLPSNGFSPSRQTRPCGDELSLMPVMVRQLAAAGLLSAFVAGLGPVAAFDNGIPEMAQYRSQAKYPGTRPSLGLQGNGKLAACDYEPHCFSTSGDESHLLKLWRPKAGSNAMAELLDTVKAYPPFQARID